MFFATGTAKKKIEIKMHLIHLARICKKSDVMRQIPVV